MAERAASMVSWFRSMSKRTCLCGSALDHFRHFEEVLIHIGRVSQRFFMWQGRAQSEKYVFAAGIGEALARDLGGIDSISIGHLRHRFDFVGVQAAQLIDILEDGI